MSKKILVLTGSPRQGGNTDILAEAFIEGAQRAGNQVFRFDAGRKNVSGCVACETCFSSGHPCSYVDDFEEYAGYLKEADVLAMSDYADQDSARGFVYRLYRESQRHCPVH